jgi:hypothetical protein
MAAPSKTLLSFFNLSNPITPNLNVTIASEVTVTLDDGLDCLERFQQPPGLRAKVIQASVPDRILGVGFRRFSGTGRTMRRQAKIRNHLALFAKQTIQDTVGVGDFGMPLFIDRIVFVISLTGTIVQFIVRLSLIFQFGFSVSKFSFGNQRRKVRVFSVQIYAVGEHFHFREQFIITFDI